MALPGSLRPSDAAIMRDRAASSSTKWDVRLTAQFPAKLVKSASGLRLERDNTLPASPR